MKDERDKAAPEPTVPPRDADAPAPDGSVRVGGYSVRLPEFDGPLDLLLTLIQEHELNILDIPIGFIATKYVEYITLMQQLNIDLASEYLVMAATLAHIKSKMLLPAPPEDQEDGEEIELDPRAELVRRLLEYQKYKHVAEQLANRELLGRDVFVRAAGNPVPEGQAPLAPVTLFKLLEAFKRVLDRAHQTIDHQVQFERLSLTDRINELVDVLREQESFVVSSLFEAQRSRAELVVTLLALLEMTRLRMIRLTQVGPLEEITVELAVSEEEAVLAAAAAAAAAGDTDRLKTAVSEPSERDSVSAEESEPAEGDSESEHEAPEAAAAEPTSTTEPPAPTAGAGPGLEPGPFEPTAGAMPSVESQDPDAGASSEPSLKAAEEPARDPGPEASMEPNSEQQR
jgi:segregation and condensation protein A